MRGKQYMQGFQPSLSLTVWVELKLKDYLNFFTIGRRLHFFGKWMTTLLFWKNGVLRLKEGNLIFNVLENERQP